MSNQDKVSVTEDLVYLVSCAVNEQKPDIEKVKAMDLEKLYRLSQFHLLTSVLSFALQEVIPLPHAFDQEQKKTIRKMALFDIERSILLRKFEQAGIWYLPLKGIVLKEDYPKSAMREMHDNDILVDPTRMADIKAIMEQSGYTCKMYNLHNHDVYAKPPTLEFEIHHTLFDDDILPDRFITYYADIKEKLQQNGYVCKMTDEDFYIYMLSHIYKHYIHGGTGLRSLLDVYVFLRKHTNLNKVYLHTELEKLRLTDFEQKMRNLSQKIFTDIPLTQQEQNDMDYFILSGNNGTFQQAEYHQMVRNLDNDDSKTAKYRYLKKRIFISGKTLQKQYPFVAKHKGLYPFLLVYRSVKGTVTHPRQIIGEYKKVKQFKKKDG